MFALRNMTIKQKLTVIIMLTSVVALVLVGSVFVIIERSNTRRTMARNLSTNAEMIADNCKAAMAFEDVKDAEETLQSLHVESSIVFGCIYSNNGEIFATYERKGTSGELQVPKLKDLSYNPTFADGFLTVAKHISLDEEVIGTACLISDLAPMYAAARRSTEITITILLFAFLLAYLMSSSLQRIISEPILNLAEVARMVSEKKDYSTRALKRTSDEVGLLIDAFNEMLTQIQQRDSALVDSKQELELRVRDRTAELTVANNQLTAEIGEREKAERKQNQLLKELESVNQELKDFAYIASHDLKAPLRAIKTLAEWISSDYGDKLDENGKEQMKLLSSRVDRMHNLIEGILQYSRVGRIRQTQVQVNLSELVPEIIDVVAPPENITVTVESELPVITCEETRITQVFQNLLSNAVKYMDKPKGRIGINCIEENEYWKFSVTDNGPGIEEKHFERIFKIFQTLSSRDEYESTGVGLTVVKKIVEMYGGRIWVESEVGKGSTFFFTLSKFGLQKEIPVEATMEEDSNENQEQQYTESRGEI